MGHEASVRGNRLARSRLVRIDVASQGATEEEALSNFREALELHFEPPQATRPPRVRTITVK